MSLLRYKLMMGYAGQEPTVITYHTSDGNPITLSSGSFYANLDALEKAEVLSNTYENGEGYKQLSIF